MMKRPGPLAATTPPRRGRAAALVAAALLAPLSAGPPAAAQEREDPFRTLFGEDRGASLDEDLPEEPLPRAAALLAIGRHDEAEALLLAARAQGGDGGEAAAAVAATLARLYLKTGRLADADAEGACLRRLDPADPLGHLVAGVVAERRGQLAAAAEAYRSARAFSREEGGPLHVEALVRLGRLLAETDGHEVGAAALEAALAYYQEHDDLEASEFVWTGRACQALDFFPAVKRQFQRRMTDYARRMIDQALLRDERCVEAHLLAGALALDKYDAPQARAAFERACALDPNHPEARVGLAQALLASFYAGEGQFGDAASNLRNALAVDPGNAAAHALLAAVAVTDGELDAALERLDNALREAPADVDLLAVKAAVAVLRGDEDGLGSVERLVLAQRPRCARFYDAIAQLVSLKFRYAEARDLARRALAADPGYHPALSTLGVNLTRTGDEAEGRRVLLRAFEEDPYNVYTFNHLRLFDHLDAEFATLEAGRFTVRMHRDEAPGSSRYVLALLREAEERLGARYGALPEHVLVELFGEHNDFSARSVGLPGIPALGVCFGNVVTVLSARERDAVGAHAWGRTLWHELTHVLTLTRTRNRIPRWFTEGLSVHEEPRARPTWQREYEGALLTLLHRDLLLPIAGLDAGFTKPTYPGQVLMAYYQGGATCELIESRWGFPAILGLLDAYATGADTPRAIRTVLGIEPEAFDGVFRAYLQARLARYAHLPPPSLEERNALLDRVGGAPWDVAARGALARAYALHGATADAEAQAGLALRHAALGAAPFSALSGTELFGALPGADALALARAAGLRAGAADAYLALGLVAHQRGRTSLAGRRLRRALELGTRDPVTAHGALAQVLRAQQRPREAIGELLAAARLVPPDANLHRLLRGLWEQVGDGARAMLELRAVCALDSNDAQARVEYATWARRAGRWAEVVEVLDDVNLIDPFQPDAHLLLGEALRRTAVNDRGKLERALDELQAAIDLDVRYKAGPLLGQAQCLAALGRGQDALARARAALEQDPGLAEARALVERLEREQR